MKSTLRSAVNATALVVSLGLFGGVIARAADAEIPHLVQKDGRHALIVDGAPFLVLGGQCHNSSAWPITLPGVWSAIEALHANTLEVPISWEQFEPEPGRFDTSIVDELLAGARQRQVRLVLLWFGTWKNGSAHYLPLWMKRQPELYPRIVGKDGRRVDSPSPHAPALLEADVRAFRALMRHLKAADPQRTVIMVQVENEPGAWNTIRDYSPAARKLFTAPVPAELLKALGTESRAGADWTAVFGKDADELFHAWSVARFVGEVAAAGKAEYPLPLYVNAALRDPLSNPAAGTYESGGPTDNVLDVWKAAAPAVDLLAPDIYMGDSARYLKVLDLYRRPDNALFVPETGLAAVTSRYFFAALARGAIGWSPFGIESLFPVSAAASGPPGGVPAGESFAVNYRVVGPMMRELARMAFEGRLHAAIEEKNEHRQVLELGRWRAVVTFGPVTLGYGRSPSGNPEPVGRVLIAELGEDEFLVTGHLGRVDFEVKNAASGAQREFLRVEEGRYEDGAFRPQRIWNGDETDWALNFDGSGQVLRVRLGAY